MVASLPLIGCGAIVPSCGSWQQNVHCSRLPPFLLALCGFLWGARSRVALLSLFLALGGRASVGPIAISDCFHFAPISFRTPSPLIPFIVTLLSFLPRQCSVSSPRKSSEGTLSKFLKGNLMENQK